MSAIDFEKPTKPSPSCWIISPRWDIVFFLGTPLVALVPALLVDTSRMNASHWMMLLAVVATGHHMPGFIRAYSDKELFNRYKTRMLVAPVLLLAAALWLEFAQVPGMRVILILWGAWHFIMQNYGIMRIYGVKVGDISRKTAMLDWLVMLSWIFAVYLNTPSWSYDLQTHIYRMGFPFLPVSFLRILETTAFSVAILVTIVYAVYNVRLAVIGKPINPLKYVLLGTTLIFFVSAFQLTTNIFFATVMVELVHDLQYYALAWVFQRRLVAKQTDKRSFLRYLFRPTPAMIMLYMAICFAYGAVVGDYGQSYLFEGTLIARFTAATLIACSIYHFYIDGFIWRVRQARTREYLGIEAGQASVERQPSEPLAWRSLLHIASYVIVVSTLILAHDPSRRSLIANTKLVERFPNLGEARFTMGKECQAQSWHAQAIKEFALAADLGVHEPIELRLRMATSLESLQQYQTAIQVLGEALALAPSVKTAEVAGRLALLLTECPQVELRDAEEAVRLAELSSHTKGPLRAKHLNILTTAYMVAGRHKDALDTAVQARKEAIARGDMDLVRQIDRRLLDLRVNRLPYER